MWEPAMESSIAKRRRELFEKRKERAVNSIRFRIDEYAELEGVSRENATQKLHEDFEWSPDSAWTLVNLAEMYGSFILASAYAYAVVRDIEDGELGF